MKRTFFVLGCTLAFAAAALADTYVSGNLVTNQTWNEAGSPYIISGDVYLAPNLSLTIEQGTTVMLEAGALLGAEPHCTVRILGTEAYRVLFTSAEPSPHVGDFVELAFASAGSSVEMRYCDIEFGMTGLFVDCGIEADNVNIRNCQYGIMVNLPAAEIAGFTIENCTVAGVGTTELSGSILRRMLIANCGAGVICSPNSAIALVDSEVRDNHGIGVVISSRIENTRVTNNTGHGVVLLGATLASGCFVAENGGIGVVVADQYPWADVHINHNNILDNGDYELAVDSTCYPPVIDATNNYWGTAVEQIISERILDAEDNSGLTSVVEFVPFEDSVGTRLTTWGSVKSLFLGHKPKQVSNN